MNSLTTPLTDRRHTRGRSHPLKPPSHRPCRSLSAHKTSSHPTQVLAACRFRPLLPQEDCEAVISYPSERSVCLRTVGETQTFTLDRVFSPSASQEDVFQQLGKAVVADVQAGFNGSVFAYGQTGSGKTYTMIGGLGDTQGLIPRCAAHLLQSRGESELVCSMVEIYREKVLDLLHPSLKPLKVKESPSAGVFLQGVMEVCVTSEQEVMHLLRRGAEQRTVAATTLNQLSSRSHAIVTLKLRSSHSSSVLHLVDLAGSERLSVLQVPASILQDAKKINLSLSVLGTVILALATGAEHVPYRDSKLTRVLQEAFGGNCKTHVLVNCSPAATCLEESLMTLRFAQRTKRVRNQVFLTTKQNSNERIQALEKELRLTREELQRYRDQVPSLTPRRQRPKEHEGSPPSFDCSATYRVLTADTFEDSYFDSARKARAHTPVDSFSPDHPILDLSRPKRPDSELAELRRERDKYRQRAEELSDKLRQACVKIKSQQSRQDSDAEKRKILMLKISGDAELMKHMKTRIALLTKQVKQLTTALEGGKENEAGSWALFSLGVRCEIKDSLCAVQAQQIVDLECAVGQVRQTSSHLRHDLLRAYKELAEQDGDRACRSVLGQVPVCEEPLRYSCSSEGVGLLAKRLTLTTQELEDKDQQLQHSASALQAARCTIHTLQDALARLQRRDLPWIGACGDTQPPEEV